MRAGGDVAGGVDLRAFIMEIGAGELAVTLGIAEGSDQGQDKGSLGRVGYVRRLPTGDVDDEALDGLRVQHAEVHLGFDADLAAHLTGRQEADIRRVVLIGAGAIGSHVATCLAREGRFRWTVVDDDILLPHNLAGHTSSWADVGRRQGRDRRGRPDRPRSGRFRHGDPYERDHAGRKRAIGFRKPSMTRTSSSTRRPRWRPPGISRAGGGRRGSGASSSTLLVARPCSSLEPADRSVTLHDLEAQYMALLLRDDALRDHLEPDGHPIAYTGACRALTSRIPENRVMALSGLVAGGLRTSRRRGCRPGGGVAPGRRRGRIRPSDRAAAGRAGPPMEAGRSRSTAG